MEVNTGSNQAPASVGKESIVVNDTSGALSPETFDQLDASISAAKPRKRLASKKDEGWDDDTIPKESKKELKEAKDGADVSDKKNDTSEKDSKKGTDKEIIDAKQKAKSFRAKLADKELELSGDLELSHKIGGKEETFKLADLLNDFAGKTDWTRKYSEFDRDKKAFDSEKKLIYSEREELRSSLTALHDIAVNQKNPRGAIEQLADAIGADPLETWKQLVAQVQEAFGLAETLSPEERKQRDLEDENKYLRQRSEKTTAEQKRKQELETTRIQLQKLRETNEIDEQEFVTHYRELEAEIKNGTLQEKDLTPEFVVSYIRELRKMGTLSAALSEVIQDPEIAKKANLHLNEVWVQNPSFKIEDLKDIAVQVYGSKQGKKSALATKVEQAKKPQVSKSPQNESLNWDDL